VSLVDLNRLQEFADLLERHPTPTINSSHRYFSLYPNPTTMSFTNLVHSAVRSAFQDQRVVDAVAADSKTRASFPEWAQEVRPSHPYDM
jgi:hypothetical protein